MSKDMVCQDLMMTYYVMLSEEWTKDDDLVA